MIVGIRLVLDQNLTDYADAHLARLVFQRQLVEGPDDFLDKLLIRQIPFADELACRLGETVMFKRFTHDDIPRLIQLVGTSCGHFVRTHPIQAFHQQIADDQRLDGTMQQRWGRLAARIVFDTLRGDGNDRNLWIAGIHQRLADQAEVVGGAAHAAGLRDGERSGVRIILAFQNRIHKLADNHDGRIAGIVVHVLQADFDIIAAGVLENVEFIAAGTDHGFHQ